MTEIKSAVTSLINHWKEEGEFGTHAEMRSDAFLHLRWRLETMSLSEALRKMSNMSVH